MKSSKLHNYIVYYNNSQEYHSLKNEIFTQDIYYFESNTSKPTIIDAGAHIGLSTLYFKKLYPLSKIIAIEPNEENFKLLEKNIFENQIENVTLVKAALSDHCGTENLFSDKTNEKWYSSAGFHQGSWIGSQETECTNVQTHTLSEFITQPIDFLKMDIEGAEQKVLTASSDSLPMIKQMTIEFHTHQSQSLKKLVDFLENTHRIELLKNTKPIAIKKVTGLVLINAEK